MAERVEDTTRLAALVARADDVYRDYRLGSVQAWKARTGGLAIGFMPIYVPRELVHAAGMESSHLLPDKPPAEFDRVFDVKADGWHHVVSALGNARLGAGGSCGDRLWRHCRALGPKLGPFRCKNLIERHDGGIEYHVVVGTIVPVFSVDRVEKSGPLAVGLLD